MNAHGKEGTDMKKRNLAIVLLCCVFALTLGLVGCGGGSGSGGNSASASADPVAQSKEAFTGSWDLTGMVSNGEEMSQENLDLLKSMNMEVYLELKDDGTANLVVFDEVMAGTWTPKTATTADSTFENETIALTLEGDTLTMTQGDDKMTFVKGEAHAAVASSSASLVEDVEFVETREFEAYTVVDDDIAKVSAHAQVLDEDGDMGYLLTIENKSDIPIYVTTVNGSFSVNGTLVDPVLAESVPAGETVESYMFFWSKDLGTSSLDDLVAVEGTIEIWNDDSLETLGSYTFKM